MDKRKNYYLIIDVETASSMANPLTYDVGFAIADKKGNIEKEWSYIVSDIFFDEKKIYKNYRLMKSAYYAEKIPHYHEMLFDTKEIECKSLYYIKKVIENACKEWNVKAICAYNAQFDTRSLEKTLRYVSKSAYTDMLPTDIPIFDIWGMACETICRQKSFYKFCEENGFISDAENYRTSAEVVYAYMTKNPDFVESHTGLEDVRIETKIMAKCFAQHKRMTKTIFAMPWKVAQPTF